MHLFLLLLYHFSINKYYKSKIKEETIILKKNKKNSFISKSIEKYISIKIVSGSEKRQNDTGASDLSIYVFLYFLYFPILIHNFHLFLDSFIQFLCHVFTCLARCVCEFCHVSSVGKSFWYSGKLWKWNCEFWKRFWWETQFLM